MDKIKNNILYQLKGGDTPLNQQIAVAVGILILLILYFTSPISYFAWIGWLFIAAAIVFKSKDAEKYAPQLAMGNVSLMILIGGLMGVTSLWLTGVLILVLIAAYYSMNKYKGDGIERYGDELKSVREFSDKQFKQQTQKRNGKPFHSEGSMKLI